MRDFAPGECEQMKAALQRINTKIILDNMPAAELPDFENMSFPQLDSAALEYDAAGTMIVPSGTIRIHNMRNNHLFKTVVVPLQDHGHDVLPAGTRNADKNGGVVSIIAPTRGASKPVMGGGPAGPMRTEHLLTLSHFLQTGSAQKYLDISERKKTVARYFVPMILSAVLARELGFGFRMYFDKHTFDFLHMITARETDFMQVLPEPGSYDLGDAERDAKTDALLAVVRANLMVVQKKWLEFVQSFNMADAMCHILWFVMSGYDDGYIRNWHQSAQLLVVDILETRPEWHETVAVGGARYVFLKDDGYLASAWRLLSMRQKRDIRETINGVEVHYPRPRSIHIRDPHTNAPSFGDYQHSVVDFFQRHPTKSYEWCISPGIYTQPWGNFGRANSHIPICCAVNGKVVGQDPCIMSDEDYADSVGKLWDDNFVDTLRKHRKYRAKTLYQMLRGRGVNTGRVFDYGIDEILLTMATGIPRKIDTSLADDAWAECFNNRPSTLMRWRIKYSPANEIAGNELLRHTYREPNSIMAKSVNWTIVWIWMTRFLMMFVGKDTVSQRNHCVSKDNKPYAYFFPQSGKSGSQWHLRRGFVDRRQRGGAIVPKDKVRGFWALLDQGNADKWAASGYADASDFVTSNPPDQLFQDPADNRRMLNALLAFEDSETSFGQLDTIVVSAVARSEVDIDDAHVLGSDANLVLAIKNWYEETYWGAGVPLGDTPITPDHDA
jgi:hypothetical protein